MTANLLQALSRLHTTEARQPVLAIADSECNITLAEWDVDIVSIRISPALHCY